VTLVRSELEELLAEAGVDENRVRWDYSGRGMYGRTCLGFVGGVADLARFFYQVGLAVALQEEEFTTRGEVEGALREEDARHLADVVTTDDVGRDTIFYFPGVRVEDDHVEPETPDPDAVHDAVVDRELGV
jgi:hypothetical protein